MSGNLSSTVKFILGVGMAFGLSPIAVDSKGQARIAQAILAYTVSLALAFVALVVVDEYHQAHDKTYVVDLVNTLGVVGTTVQFLANLIFGWIKVNQLSETVASLLRLEKYVFSVTRLKVDRGKVWAFAGGLLASIAFAVTFALGYENYDLRHVQIASKLRFVLLYVTLASTGVVVFQICSLAFVILQLYNNLNVYLDDIFSGKVILKRNGGGLFLEDFRVMLLSANGVSESLNGCYSSQMAMVFLNGFVNIIVHSYHALKDSRTYYQYYVATSSKLGVFFYHMMLLALVFQLLANKVTMLGSKLFKFPKDNLGSLRLEAFQLSQHVRYYPMDFTAKHFFKIEIATMLSILATASSYLIILMQSSSAPSAVYSHDDNIVGFASKT